MRRPSVSLAPRSATDGPLPACGQRVNERTGTPFNDLRYPTDIMLLALPWHLRYKLSFRDVAELLLERGDAVTHETVRVWLRSFCCPQI